MNIKVNEITTTMLFIGFEGEQNHATVQFDCASVFAEYPEATVYMTIEPPTGSIYPKEVTRNGNIVEWVVSAGDCAYPGKGMYQITFTSGNVIVKSFVGNYVVRDSLIANGNPPDPVDEWIEQAEDLLNEFENISASAETLEPGTQATAEMTEVDGHKNIAFGIPQGEKGDIGLTPDISIGTVETGEAGTDASASMTGTPENPVLNLRIPRGNPGEVTEAELKEVADSKAPVIIDSANGSIASFTDGADNLPVEDCVVQIEPVQEGSGDPAPDNVRPITGWTGANVVRTGKNLLNLSDNRQGSFDSTTIANNVCTDGYLAIKGGQNYIWSTALSVIGGRYIRFYDKDKTLLSNNSISLYGTGDKTFTAPQNATYLRAMWFRNTGITPSDITADQIELGSTATSYEPYFGTTYPITWSSAGTVYGGELDVTSGVLKVTKKSIDLGTLSWRYFENASHTKSYFRTSDEVSDMKPSTGNTAVQNIIASIFKTETWSNTVDNVSYDECACIGWAGKAYIAIADSRYNDAIAFTTAMSGVQLVYPLATPVEYTLSAVEIATLLGQNNIFADTGDTSVQYRADTKLFITKLINSLQQ